ncbi:DUF4232 domain-containing protein [Streptomyces sp. NRRL F-5053]|uniref:DUF4232 domain-containing protein n=1 Tax=Streptomyces sp. NRRL F-5053 TaxID=1463854 RepID=UPI001F334C53|nr:DUF4232 domain-containing protein [Streptomyces sp. NRRL F-5053]
MTVVRQQQQHAQRATGRPARHGPARGRIATSTRLAAVVAAGLSAALLAGCGNEKADDSAPKKVAGDAAPAPGDSPGGGSHKKGASPSSSSSAADSGHGDEKGGDTAQPGAPGKNGGGSSGGKGGGGGGPAAPGGSGGACKTSELGFSTSHGMGEGTLLVNLRNNGSAACTLQGFPGVDLQTEGGALNAGRSGLAAPRVSVAPGEETRFTLHYPPNDTGGSGVNVTGLVVTPPGETQSQSVPATLNLPVTEGPGSSVTVDPVGVGK